MFPGCRILNNFSMYVVCNQYHYGNIAWKLLDNEKKLANNDYNQTYQHLSVFGLQRRYSIGKYFSVMLIENGKKDFVASFRCNQRSTRRNK